MIISIEAVGVLTLFLVMIGEQRKPHRKLPDRRWNRDFPCKEWLIIGDAHSLRGVEACIRRIIDCEFTNSQTRQVILMPAGELLGTEGEEPVRTTEEKLAAIAKRTIGGETDVLDTILYAIMGRDTLLLDGTLKTHQAVSCSQPDMAIRIALDGIETSHTYMEPMVDWLKTVAFIVIEEDSPAVGDGPEAMGRILIASGGLIDGIVAASGLILMTSVCT